MKLFRLLLATVFVVIGMVHAQNVMILENATGTINSNVTMSVAITNADPFTAFQADILIPAGFSFVSNSAALNPARLPAPGSHNISAAFIAPNIVRLVCFSFTNQNFTGNSGSVATFQVNPGANVCGDYNTSFASGTAFIYNTSVVNIITGTTNGMIYLNPTVSCPPNSDVCVADAPFALTGGLPAGGTYSGTGVSGGIFSPAVAGVGPHTITYTYNCTANAFSSCTFQITVLPLMSVGTIQASQTICTGTAPNQLTSTPPTGVSNPTYQWQSSLDNNTFTNILGATFAEYQPGVLTATTYYRQMQNAPGSCGGPLPTNVLTITVNPNLAVGTISASQTICSGIVPAQLTGTPPNGTSPTYQWQSSLDNVSFTNITGATDLNYQPAALTATTYYQLIQDAANTCGGPLPTNVVTITVNPLPAAIAGIDRAICFGASTQIGAAAVAGNTYSWTSVPAGFTSTVADPTVSPAVTTTYTLVETITATGCSKSNSVVVTVNPLPVVTAGTYGPLCSNGPAITLGGTPAGGTWTGTGVTGNQFNPSAGTQTLTYTYTDGNGCTNFATTTVTVNTAPVVTAGTYGPVCYNAPAVTLGGTPAGGVWTGTGVTGNQSAGYVFNPSAGTQTLTYTYTDANLCSASATTTITVDPQFVVGSIVADQTICGGQIPAPLLATPPNGTSPVYQWQISLDNVTFTDIPGATDQSYQPGTITATTYFRQIQNSAGTCGGPGTTNVVTISFLPSIVVGTISADQTICPGQTPAMLTGTPPANGTTPTYQWQSSLDNNTFTNIAGATALTYQPGPISAVTYFRLMQSALGTCGGPLPTNVVTISFDPNIIPGTIAASQTICPGQTPALLTGTAPANGTAPTYQWQSSLDNNTFTNIAGATALNYQPGAISVVTYFRLMQNATGVCGGPLPTNVVMIDFNPTIVPGTIAANQTICQGQTPALLTGTAPANGTSPTYQWQSSLDNNTFTNIAGATALTYQPGAISATTYFRLMQNATGVCGGPLPTNVVTISFYPTLIPGTIAANQSICQGQTPALLTGTAPANGTAPTYQWQSSLDNNTFNNIAGATGLNYQPGTISATTYFRLMQNATGVCGGPLPTNVVTISFNPNLVVGSISANQTICSGAPPAQLNGVAPSNGTSPTYQWQSGPSSTGPWADITGATGLNYQPGPLTTTTYYRQQQNASNTCGGPLFTNVVTITVNPVPTPTITGNATACQNSTNNTYTTQTGMTGYTWTVSAGGTITAGANTNAITVTWTTSGAKTVCVNYANANGCTAPTPTCFNVTVNPAPTPTITGLNVVCAGTTGVAYSTQAGMTNYVWTIVGGTITSGQGSNNVLVTWNTAGSQSISVNYTNSNGCSAPTPTVYPVTVNAKPTPTITGPASVCVNSTGNVYTTQTGMTGYTWTVSTGGTITSGSTSNAITVTWNTAGAQTVTVTYTNASNCSGTGSYNVTVNALPVPTITGPTAACVGATNTYTTQPGMTNYVWPASIPGATIVAGGTSTSNTITINWLTAGVKAITVNYTNPSGCTATSPTTLNVTVNPTPTPTIGSTNDPCLGSSVVYYTESGMTGYVWTASAGGTVIAGQGTSTCTIQWNTLGQQTVTVSYSNTQGCTGSTVYTVFVNAPPSSAGSITGPATGCQGTTGVYSIVTMPSGADQLMWSVPSDWSVTPASPTTSTSITVTYGATSGNVTVYGKNSTSQCTGPVSTKTVTVNALPATAGTITGPATVCSGSTYTYTVPAITGATSYVWTIPTGATGTSTTNSISITFVNPPASGVITVKGSNSCGTGAASPNFNVTINPKPVAVVTANGNVLTCTPAGGTYQWYYEGTAISGATGQSYTVTNNTGYYWCVVTLNGCTSDISNKVWITVVGVPELPANASFNVFPVPNNGQFTASIKYPVDDTFTISVYNLVGEKIYELRDVKTVGGSYETQIDLRPITAGMYSVIFKNSSNRVVKKILINN